MFEDVIVKGNLTTTKENGEFCLLGKLEWHLNYEDRRDMGVIKHSHVTVIFNKLEAIRAMEVLKEIKEMRRDNFEFNKEYYLVAEEGIKIHVSDDTTFKHFQKAIRHLYGFAISEMAENGISVKVNVAIDE